MKKSLLLIIIVIGIFSCLSKRQTPEDHFWNWFTTYSQEFFKIDDLSDKRLGELLDPLSRHLNQYCNGLTFEIGYDKDSFSYELVVSADVNKKLFPIVETLVSSAPDIKQWKITALRQPKGNNQKIEYGGYIFDSEEILFLPKINQEDLTEVNIEVLYPNYTEENRNILLGGTFLLLDAVIGEKSTETDIAYINVSKTPDDLGDFNPLPLSELRDFIRSKKKNSN